MDSHRLADLKRDVQGSEVVVRLPTLVEATAAPPEPIVSEPAHPTARRILVVDDNRDSANTLAMLLKQSGHETHTAFDGLEAVDEALTWRPEVLLDIGLPNLNGYGSLPSNSCAARGSRNGGGGADGLGPRG